MTRLAAAALAAALLLPACEAIVKFDAPPERAVQCTDGIDNDGDGDIDCQDDDCMDTCSAARCGNGKIDKAVFAYAAGVSVAVSGGPLALAAARVNGDAQTDVLVATAGNVRELRNDGGTLVPQTPLDTSASGTILALAAGRFDAGDTTDAALLLGPSPRLLPVLNDAGTLRAGRPVTLDVSGVTSLVAGAFDAKAGDDLLVGGDTTGLYLSSDGAGSFGVTFLQLPAAPRTLAAGDLEKDGDLDAIAVSRASSQAYLLTNIGVNTTPSPFRAERTLAIGAEAGAVAFLDADGMGDRDAVVLEAKDQRARILLASVGTLTAGATLLLGGTPASLAVGDFDLDGHDDVAVGMSGGSILIFVNDGHGAFSMAGSLNAGSADALIAVDLDANRGLELVVAEKAQSRVTVFSNLSMFEQCDDGNTMSGDSCNADCTLP